MDKSFNDDELSDIMKEIEALEEDFAAADDKSASNVMEELADMDVEKSIPVAKADVVSIESKRSAPIYHKENSTSMSFKVQGDLTLELKFDIGGKEVFLEVTETGLTIEMEGGVKFSVPVSDKSDMKKAV